MWKVILVLSEKHWKLNFLNGNWLNPSHLTFDYLEFFCRFSGFPVFPYESISFIKKWFVQGFEVSGYNFSTNTDCQIKQIIKKTFKHHKNKRKRRVSGGIKL